jgi:HlyD family secretion protein
MINKVLIPILAVAGFIFGLYMMVQGNKPIEPAQPVAEPASPPYALVLTGSGIIEASSENIAIATNIAGVVRELYVKQGSVVKTGDPLFMVDNRVLSAELKVRESELATARQNVAWLESLPRPEDVSAREAELRAAQSTLADARKQYDQAVAVKDGGAMSDEEFSRRKSALEVADARVSQAEAQLALVRAGTWKPELDIARAKVTEAQARLDSTRTEVERLTVRSPIDGEVLQRNIRVGEFAQAGALSTPLLVVGNTETLAVRVDIDENDAWRFSDKSPARAFVRGNSQLAVDLQFGHLEPYVVPKRSLTGESTERVDTRVMQVVYTFERSKLPVLVGQMMDVFIEDHSSSLQVSKLKETPSRNPSTNGVVQ